MEIKVNGLTVNYEIAGNGPWVTLSHSLACDLHMWDEQMDALTKKYKVLRYDTRGHGKSSAPQGAYSLDMLADDLKALLDAVGIAQCHFAGLSMGGMIGQTFALKYPGVFKSLTLADTSSGYPPDAGPMWEARIKAVQEKGMAGMVEGTLGRWFTEPFRKSRPDVIKRMSTLIENTPPNGFIGCCHAIPKINTTGRLHEITTPVMIVVGDQDGGTPVAMSEAMFKARPQSDFYIIKDASHISNVEKPAAFSHVLTTFLAKHR